MNFISKTTTFGDIFKSSYTDNITSFSVVDTMIALALAFAIGIFIYFLGLCLNNYNINHSIEVFSDNEQNDAELTLSAIVKFI